MVSTTRKPWIAYVCVALLMGCAKRLDAHPEQSEHCGEWQSAGEPTEADLHDRKLVLNAEEGKTYFVAAGYRPERSWAFPLAGDPVVIKQITEDEARPLLQELTAQ